MNGNEKQRTPGLMSRFAGKITSQSEKDYLREKAKTAKSDLLKTAGSLLHSVFGRLDVRGWTREHPFQSTGAAAGVGFIVANAVGGRAKAKPQTEGKPEKPHEPFGLSAVLFPILYEAAADIAKSTLLPLLQKGFAEEEAGQEGEEGEEIQESAEESSLH